MYGFGCWVLGSLKGSTIIGEGSIYKGPGTPVAYALALKYEHRTPLTAEVYTTRLHGPKNVGL